MDGKYKRLMKNSAVFMIANFGSKFFSFILVPFYTHVLTTAEFGTVDTLVATVSLFSPIATFGIGDVIVMYLSKKEYPAKKIFTNTAVMIIAGNILVSLTYPFLFLSDIFNHYMAYFVLLVCTASVYGVLQMYARGTGKVVCCAIGGVTYTVTLGLSNILLLLVFNYGISGYLTSVLLAYLVPSLYLLFMVKDKCIRINLIDKKLIKNILKLSIPLIPTAVLWTLMNLADKYAILWNVGVSGNGLYAVAHKIPTLISLIYGIFQQAWQLTTFELVSKEDRTKTYSNIFELLTCVVFCAAGMLVIVNRIYITYLCDAKYLMAWTVSPILMYSAIMNCLSGFLGSNYLIMHNTKAALKVTAVGAILNVVLNLLLVPVLGLHGAAMATCLGFMYMVIKKYKDTGKFTPLRISIKRFAVSNILLVCMCLAVNIKSVNVYYLVSAVLALLMLINYRSQYVRVKQLVMNRFKKR